MKLTHISICLAAAAAISLAGWASAEKPAAAEQPAKVASQPADQAAMKAKRLAELETRLKDDKEMDAKTRANLEKLVTRLKAELAPAKPASQQQTKLD